MASTLRRVIRAWGPGIGGLALLGVILGSLGLGVGHAQGGNSLLVQAMASTWGTLARSTDPVFVYVTVQSTSGLLESLNAQNFTVFAEQLPPKACRVEVTQVRSNRPGIYRLVLIPARDVSGCTWQLGEYLLSVSVRVGSQSGAALALLRF